MGVFYIFRYSDMKVFNIICLIIILLMVFFIYTMDQRHKETIITQKTHIDSLETSLSEIQEVQKQLTEALNKLPLKKPLSSIEKCGKFGYRKDPFTKKWSYHYGIDLVGKHRDTVYATGDGLVVLAKWNFGYGRCVIIEHEDNFKSLYAHLSKIYVKKGDHVDVNQKIGKCGSTGRSTGAHLHYEVIHNGHRVNPCSFIDPLNNNYCN